jgi:hypothetical protein
MYGPNFTKGYQGRGFQALSSTDVFVLGTDGNLWNETGPWGQVPPPSRMQVDGNVAAFQALSLGEAYVLGTNGNLWHEMGPWGIVPPPIRQQVDGNVAAFQALSSTEAFVLGTDGNLWLEKGPWGPVPPPRQHVIGNVAAFQALSPSAAYVLTTNGGLSLLADIGEPLFHQEQVDGNVAAFQALGVNEVYVLGTNGNLWHETGPWGQVPPPRQQVDGNVAAFQALSSTEAYVLGTNGNLWHETGPWGQVPPPRQQVDGNAFSFHALSGTEAYVEGTDSYLWHETGPWGQGTPARQQVDANVWPDNGIIINSYPNVSGLDGTATLRVYKAGGYHFSGGWTPSNVGTGLIAQDVNLVFTLRDSQGTLWVFSTAGTVPIEGSYNFNYWGTYASLAESWQALAAGYTWHDDYSASLDLLATGNEIIDWYNQNKDTINEIVQVVGFIAGLV